MLNKKIELYFKKRKKYNFFVKFLFKVFVGNNREIIQVIKLKVSSCMLNIIKHNKITCARSRSKPHI